MQKNLMLERKQKQYIIRSTTVGEANTGIDAGFVRAVHRNLKRMYQLYVFVFARGKRAMSEAQNADYVVKIESGTKRQSEQYALFYALSPVLYAKTVHDAMAKGVTAAEYEDYQVEPITVCAAEDMDSLTEKLSGIRCRTQKDFLASMRVFCRAVVSIETPYNMTIDVKNEADMDTVLDYTKDYFLEEEKEEQVTTPAPAAPSYNMFGSDLPAPVGFAGGINKRGDAFTSSTIGASGITPLMGNVPKVPASRPMGMFAASVPFDGARVHADAFGKIVSSHEEELPAPEEFDVTTAFNENAVLHVPEKTEPAPKPRAKKQRTSPFWIGHEDELHPVEEKPEEAPKDDAVVYEAGSLPYFAQSVEVVEEEPTAVAAEPVVEMTVEEIEEPVAEPAPAKKAPREHLILPGNVIDIFESAPEAAPTAEPGIMAYRFDYFADHSAAKKRERELKSPFEAKPASKNTETTVPDAHIDDLLLRPAVQEEAPAPVYEQEELTITFGEEEAEILENKKMHFVPVDGIEIAVFADADASEEELRAEARRIADQINHVESPEEPAEEIAEEIVEEVSAPEAVEETIEVIDEPAAAEEEEPAEVIEEPVVVEIEEPVEVIEEPVVVEIEETAEVIEEPVVIEIEEPAEVVEETVVVEIEEPAEVIEEPVIVEIEETAEVIEEPVVVEIEETAEVIEEPVVVEIEETAEVFEEPVVVEIEETAEVIEEPVIVENAETAEVITEPEEIAEETIEEVVEADESAVEETAEEVVEPAPAAINVPLFYSREADRSELDDELDEMFDELRRPAPEPKMSELDAIMLELEQGEDTRATAVLPAQDVLWQQEEAARAAARQAEEEFAQILVQHSVEAAQQTMQEQEQEQEPRDSWIDIDITDGEEEAAPETAMEEVLQVEDTLFCAEEDFSQEYVESAVQVEEEQREEPVVADETVWQAIFEDTQEIEAAAPYAYDVEVLVADEVSPQEAARIVEDYQRSVGVETEDPWLQVQQQWNIPEPQALVDGETVDTQKAEHIRQEADAIADELERETADEESLREDIDAPEGDEAFAARSQALYEKLRVVPVMVEEMPPVRQDVEIRLDDEELIADPIESADDYEIIVLDDDEEIAEEEDDIEIELYEMEEEPAQSADDYEIIVLDDDEEIAEEEDDIEIELYELEAAEEALAADLPETVEESVEAEDEIEIELYEMKEESIESADDYEIIVLDDDEEIAEEDDEIQSELYETEETAEPVMQAAQETPEEQPPVQEETAQQQEEDDFPMDPETALRQKIMREMPESLRNSPMAARAAALMATMHRVDAESARIDRRMSALNPQNDEDETRAIYGRTSVAEELPADFDLFGDEKAAQEDVPDVIELGGVTEETAEEPAQAQADVIELGSVTEEAEEETAEEPVQAQADVIELGGVVEEIVEETEEAVPVLEGELFIPADDAVAMTLPEAELVRAYGYEQVETVEDVVPVVEETAQQEDALEHTRTIAREIFEQYDSMQEEEAETEPAVDFASDAAEEEQVRDHYSPMDDAQQYFVPSAVEMDLEEEGYPGEIYDEHLIAYAAQMEEIEDFDRRMQEAYREQAAQEAAQDDEETYLEEEFLEDEFTEDFEEDSYEEESYEEEFYEEDSYVQDFVSALYDDQIEVEDVYIDGVDDLIDTLPTHREELLDTSVEEPAQTVEEDVEEELEEDIDENFDAEFEEAAQEDLDAVFDDTLIDELEEAQMDDFAIEEERLAREQERLEAEIAEQERLIAESRASRAQLDEIAAELDRSIARENLAAQRAAREQVEREKFERTQQMPAVDVQQQDYQYTEVGEPLAHRTQGKRIARHRNKRWFR